MARYFAVVPTIIGENVSLGGTFAYIALLKRPTCLPVVHCDMPSISVSASQILAPDAEDVGLLVLIVW